MKKNLLSQRKAHWVSGCRTTMWLLLFFVANNTSFGQNHRGFLVTTDGDTLVGRIRSVGKLSNPMDKKHFILQVKGQEEQKIPAAGVREYAIVVEEQNGRTPFVHYYPQLFHQQREFWSPHINGAVRLYAIYKNSLMSGTIPPELRRKNNQKIYYLSIPGEERIIQWKKRNYIEMSKLLFKDCPKLTDRLGEKNFRFEDVESIVAFYNRLCS